MNALKYSLSAFLKIVWFCCVSKACSFNSRSWFMAVTCSRVHHRGQILILIFFKSLCSSLRSWAGTLCYKESCFIPCHFPRRAEGMVSPYLLGEWRTRRQMKSQSTEVPFSFSSYSTSQINIFCVSLPSIRKVKRASSVWQFIDPLAGSESPPCPRQQPWGSRRAGKLVPASVLLPQEPDAL